MLTNLVETLSWLQFFPFPIPSLYCTFTLNPPGEYSKTLSSSITMSTRALVSRKRAAIDFLQLNEFAFLYSEEKWTNDDLRQRLRYAKTGETCFCKLRNAVHHVDRIRALFRSAQISFLPLVQFHRVLHYSCAFV